jgi:methylmalonyl-CoA mutase, C-terminal domain
MQRKIRVLVGKPGLDGHDRGAKVVAAALRDAGMEVIYTGLHQTPAQVVEAAVQEDVDVVALSILSGAHMTLFPEVLEMMRERGIGDRLLTGGGIIPPEDMESLAKMGVGRLFGPGASTQDIAKYIRGWFEEEHGAAVEAAASPPRAAAAASRPASRPAASTGTKSRAATPAKRAGAARGGPAKRGRGERAGSGGSRKRR